MRVTAVSPADDRWSATLARTDHDWYHMPGYLDLCARREHGDPLAVIVDSDEGTLLLPILIRETPEALGAPAGRDASSPYGYPGFALAGAAPGVAATDEFICAALGAAAGWLRDAGIVSLFLRIDPLASIPAEDLATIGTVVEHGQTVGVDLTQSDADLDHGIRTNHRRNINRLVREGFTFQPETGWDRETTDAFLAIYTQTMDRLGADASYYVDAEYVDELHGILGDRLVLVTARKDGEMVAGALFTAVNGVVRYHLSGTRDDYVGMSPNKGMIGAAIHWGHARGDRILHLGGGLGGREDALFQFKAGFSPDRYPFRTVRVFLDEGACADLSARWSARAGVPADDPTGFFPPWRAPLPEHPAGLDDAGLAAVAAPAETDVAVDGPLPGAITENEPASAS